MSDFTAASQNERLKVIRQHASCCREDLEVLRECLEDTGVVRPAALLARAHRRRFAAVCATHSCGMSSTGVEAARFAEWESILGNSMLAEMLAFFAGPQVAGIAACSSGIVSRTLGRIMPALQAAFPGHVYLCGGEDGDERAQTLDSAVCVRLAPGSDSCWEALPHMPARRESAAAGVIAGLLYVCGGMALDGVVEADKMLASADRFDPRRGGAWEALPPMSVARDGASAAVLAGKLYVIGGRAGQHLVLSSLECFDPQRGEWEGWGVLPLMLFPRICLASAALLGELCVCGGTGGRIALREVEALDARGLWRALPPLTEARTSAAACALGGRLYVCGGTNGRGHILRSVERLDPAGAGVWEATAPMPEPRTRIAGVAAAGRVYVFGGLNGMDVLSTSVMFDPSENSWARGPSMGSRRVYTAAALMRD